MNPPSKILSLDFMTLKGLFSDFLHNFKQIRIDENYNTCAARKKLTKTLNFFILDRNIYTHGNLKLVLPDSKFVLEVVEGKKQKMYMEINNDILKSYLDVSNDLRKRLSYIQSVFVKSIQN